MRIFLCCSKHFYDQTPPIKQALEKAGHELTLPNSYEDPMKELRLRDQDKKEHAQWKGSMLKLQAKKVASVDALLVLNFTKEGKENYIGGATFLEMYKAFELGKKIYVFNDLPDCVFLDELKGMQPVLLHGNLSLLLK